MDTVITSITFLHNIIAGLLMPWLGLLLVNIRPTMKKLCITALIYGTMGVVLRGFINLSYDISFIVQVLSLIVTIMLVFDLGLFKSVIVTVMGVIVMAGGEIISSIILINRFGPDVIASNNPLILLLLPLPQILMTLLIIYFCNRLNFYLFNFAEIQAESISLLQGKRIKTVTVLVLVLLVVIFIQLAFNMFVINQQFQMFKSIPLSMIGVFSTVILIMGVISMVFFIIQLMELTEKESQYNIQAMYIDTLDELYTAIRCERHDIINHLQTIYGFTQLGYTQEVQSYLSELLGGNILSNEFIVTGSPGLTALFYIKSGLARNNKIDFRVNVEKQIKGLKVSAYELNNILGNLINNAFDAVMPLENEPRTVSVDIGADDDNYIFKVANYGYIDDISRQRLGSKGFSTKTGEHLGLGLHICISLVKKYGGRLEINNLIDEHMVEFSLYLPIDREKEVWHEPSGQKVGAYTG